LNCGSWEGGTVADAAVGDADVDGLLLESLPVSSGAVDARVGTGLLGLDIGYVAIYRMRIRVQHAIDAAPRFLRPDPFLLHHGPSALSARVFIRVFIIRTYRDTSNWGASAVSLMP